MTEPVSPPPSVARTSPAAHPSPEHRVAPWSCSPDTHDLAGSPTPSTNGPSVPSTNHPELAATTTSSGHGARPTAKPYARSPTAWSASSTPRSDATSSTTNTSPGATTPPPRLDSHQTWGV